MEWFKHDIECMADEKLTSLVMEFGAEGYAVFFQSLEVLYRNDGEPLSKLGMRKIAASLKLTVDRVRQILDFASSEDCGHLFLKTDFGYVSERVRLECQHNLERAETNRKNVQKRYDKSTNRIPVVGESNTEKRRQDKNREDYTDSSSYKNVSHLPVDNNNSFKLAESPENASTSSEVPAARSASRTVISILDNRGEEVGISEELVRLWKDTYPAVDIMAELRKMKSWAISNPTLRKTRQGMNRFCDNWLKKEQDKAGTKTAKPSMYAPGIVADGSDPNKYKKAKTFKELAEEERRARV